MFIIRVIAFALLTATSDHRIIFSMNSKSSIPVGNQIALNHNRKQQVCVVCQQPVPFLSSSDSEPVCLRAECKQVMAKKPYMSKQSFEMLLKLRSDQIKRTVEYVTVTRKKIKEKKKTEQKENLVCWKGVVRQENNFDPKRYPYTVVPNNNRELGELSGIRKEIYHTHISEVIREVVSGNHDPEELKDADAGQASFDPGRPYPFEAALHIKACTICKGGCCSVGGNHAFLKPATIFRYMEHHPDETPAQVLDAYMSFLPETSYLDSCVNHTRSGCSLPRSMRSHVCNRFFCDGMIRICEMFEQEPFPQGIIFIQRARGFWSKDDINFDNPIVAHELVTHQDTL